MTTTNRRHQVTIPVTTPLKYRGDTVQSCGEPMHPAQYPMKNMAFTIERLVFPLTFEAVSDSRIDMIDVIQDALTRS